MYALAKWTNPLKPFSVYFGKFLEDIDSSERKVRDNAYLATMEKIKGIISFLRPASGVSGRGNFDSQTFDKLLTGNSKHLQEIQMRLSELKTEMAPQSAKIDGGFKYPFLHTNLLCRHAGPDLIGLFTPQCLMYMSPVCRL
jgi:hypothetical protein